MRVLVSGGAGYIGSTTAAHLITTGHDVTVLDNLSRGHRKAVPGSALFVQGDIGDRSLLDQVLRDGYDALLHFAAYIEAGESMQKPATYFANNTCASINLIDAVVAHGVRYVVFSSTAAVYASKDTSLSESDRIQPANVYGQSKRMIEEVLGWYRQLTGLKYCILRYFNASGGSLSYDRLRGEDHTPETHLIPLMLQVALGQRDHIAIYGDDYPTRDGTNIRDYVHIEDLALAHELALQALADEVIDQAVYNLGNGRGYSNKEVLDTVRHLTGEAIPAIMSPRRPGDAAELIASSEKIHQELGWQPRIPELERIIDTAWKWHQSNPTGYDD